MTLFGIPSERHYIRLEFASVFLARARAREAKSAPDNPLSAGENQKAPPRLPEFFGTGRDGAATLRVSPARSRALESIRTQLRVSETNGQGNSPEFWRASVGHIRATAFPQP
jgi:hypothetical protein